MSNEKEPKETLTEVPKDLNESDRSGTKEDNQLNKPTNKILDLFSLELEKTFENHTKQRKPKGAHLLSKNPASELNLD